MNIVEVSNKFPTELDAIKYAEQIRWDGQIKCAYCGSTKIGRRNKDNRWHCKSCQKSFSVTTNTYFHRTHLPLKTWMFAITMIGNAKKGISAEQLKRDLKVQYNTAWEMYHKLRDIMALVNDTVVLDDVVEMDTTMIGGKPRKCQDEAKGTAKYIPELDAAKEYYESQGYEFKEGEYKKPCKIGKQKRGKGADKITVAGIVERGGDAVAQVIQHTTFTELKALIDKHVNVDEAVMVMDSDTAQKKIGKMIDSIVIDHGELYSYRGINSNSIESFWAIIKRQIIGQHHKVSPDYLHKYVAEVVYKYNNRDDNEGIFDALLTLALTTEITV